MPSPEEQLHQKLSKLRQAFVDQLPEKLESLHEHWQLVTSENWPDEATHAFHLLVHSLIGTSSTFGFTEISNKARQLEILIKNILANKTPPNTEDTEIITNIFSALCSEMLAEPEIGDVDVSSSSSISPTHNTSIKILIVDDDTLLINVLSDHLRSQGFIVETLSHPATLLQVIDNFEPSIILMDMVFEDGKYAGAAAIEALRENGNTIPVIFISVNQDMQTRLFAIRTGAYSYLTKPLDLEQLVANIKLACNVQPDLPYRILIVDDDPEILDINSQALINSGMKVKALHNPMETLEHISAFNPELIVLDMHMPECSGLEVALAIRQISAYDDIPIVFLSAEEDMSIRMTAIKCGSDDFISKPVNLDYLVRAVQARAEKARKTLESKKIDRKTISKMASAKKLAECANRTKSEFISKMSHELRTPLNTILGYTQLLEIDHDHTLNASQKNNIQHILDSGWHLLALINDVLDISKIEIGHLSLANKETNLDEAITDALDSIKSEAQRKHLTITYDNECPQAATVYADATRLKQVLINILSNAIKYNVDNGSITVHLNTEYKDTFTVTISDTGRGLPDNKIDNLFIPFNRLGLEDTNIEGNGIGLALSAQLIKLMDGEIGAYNNDDCGASFWFRLNKYRQPKTFQTSDQVVTKVLYIEENEMDFQLVSKSLAAEKHIELYPARDAESALNLAHSMIPDVILLDIDLSSMDGSTMLNALRTHPALIETPVFALTAHDIPPGEQYLGEQAFYQYFTKPYNLTELIGAISNVLKRAQHISASGH